MPKEADPNCDGDSSSTDEGDNNKSFVKKVKSHVTGFLPSKLTKWLGAKSRQREELGDDDDTYELQPPPKRAKTHSHGFDMNHITTPLHSQLPNPFSQEFREPVAGPSITTRKLVLPVSNHFNQNQADQTNGVDSDSGESTSGYSSMPRIGSKEQVSELPGHNNAQANHNNSTIVGNKSIFNTSIPTERSLFGDHFTSPRRSHSSLSSRRPSFNASAFGAPNFMDKTLSTRRIFNSPFYSGRITYGGASAYNRSILNTSPEQAPLSPSVRPKSVNENKNAALSKTAKRILDTLEQYTSPAQDVRRIPTDHRRTPRPEGLIGKYVGACPYTVRESNKLPSQRELQVPTMSDLLKMKLKERLQDSTSTMRDIANHSSGSRNGEEYSIRNNDDDKLTTGKNTNKIKTKVSSVRQKGTPADEVVPEVKLPDVQLPISTLPTFNFSIPFGKPEIPKKSAEVPESSVSDKPAIRFDMDDDSRESKSNTNTTSSKTIAAPAINFNSPEVKSTPIASPISKQPALPKLPSVLQETKQLVKSTTTNGVVFKFSKPLVIAENKFKSIKAINNFKFSDPLVKKVLNGLPDIKKKSEAPAVVLPKNGFGDKFKVGSDKWECTECMVRNISTATTCISCTTPKATTKSTLNGPIKTTAISTTSSWGDKFKAPSSSWTCSVCMIPNDAAKEKCAACESPKPKAVTSTTQIPTTVTSFEGFSKKTDEWLCPSCMVNNAITKDKCVCCETPKPGAKPLVTQSKPPTVTSSWGDKFKVPSTTWECSMCMIRNNVDKDKCEACENPRPAGIAPPKGIDGFKKKETEWECTSCMVPNPSSKEKCVCCEAPKPGSKTVPTAQVKEVPKFSFGIENGLINGQGFMFGIPPDKNVKTDEKKVDFAAADKTTASSTPSTQFLFGIKSPNGAKTTLPSLSEVASTATPNAATPAFSFGIPTANKRPASNDEADAPKTAKKTESSGITFPLNPMNGSLDKAEAPKVDPPKFTFGAINNSPAVATNNVSSLFGTDASKSTETKTQTAAFGASTTTSIPTFSFNATPSTLTTPKNEANATTPTAALGTTLGADKSATQSTMFKFDSTAPTAAPAPTSMFNAGSTATNGTTPAPTFNFSASKAPVKPAESVAPTFKFGATNNAKPTASTFGATPAPTFGAASGTTSMFGANAAATSNVFGTSNPTAAAPAAPTFGSGMSFGSNAAPNFGSAAPTAYAPTNASAFGKPASNGVFSFGTSSNSTNDPKPAFNFGASAVTPAAGTFSFGSSASTQNTNGAFNFGGNDNTAGPNFNAAAKPAFNFTAGSAAPAALTAQPNETKGRVIRKAVRRAQR